MYKFFYHYTNSFSPKGKWHLQKLLFNISFKGNVSKYYVKTIAEEKKLLEDALSLVIHYTQSPVSNQVNINSR